LQELEIDLAHIYKWNSFFVWNNLLLTLVLIFLKVRCVDVYWAVIAHGWQTN
jgi:hypothetical protein